MKRIVFILGLVFVVPVAVAAGLLGLLVASLAAQTALLLPVLLIGGIIGIGYKEIRTSRKERAWQIEQSLRPTNPEVSGVPK